MALFLQTKAGKGEIRKNIIEKAWSTVGSLFPISFFIRRQSQHAFGFIAGTYHPSRSKKGAREYKNILGFCKSAMLEAIRKNGHVLAPSPHVGAEIKTITSLPRKMKRLIAEPARSRPRRPSWMQ